MVLRAGAAVGAFVLPVGLGVLVGVSARGFSEVGWVYAVLFLSAAVVALAQQTLP